MIPETIDYPALIQDLNDHGVIDSKIEKQCGFSGGYIRHLRNRSFEDMTYPRAARLYNLWCKTTGVKT